MGKIVVVGHSALDSVYRIEAFPPAPTKVRALEHIRSGGGSAANAAAAIARLGGDVELWSRVGDDEVGAEILSRLEAAGVGTRFVRIIPGARSSTSAVIVDARGERLVIGERDHAMSSDASWLPLEVISSAAAVLSDFNWVEAASAAFIHARASGVPTVVDADLGAAVRIDAILPLATHAIFSGPGLRAYSEGAVTEDDALAQVLKRHPVHYVGVTRGEEGYTWRSRDGGHGYQPTFKISAVDTTGAGDAFHGAFTLALTEGMGEQEAAQFASAVAALKCRQLGARAGLPTREETRSFLQARLQSGEATSAAEKGG